MRKKISKIPKNICLLDEADNTNQNNLTDSTAIANKIKPIIKLPKIKISTPPKKVDINKSQISPLINDNTTVDVTNDVINAIATGTATATATPTATPTGTGIMENIDKDSTITNSLNDSNNTEKIYEFEMIIDNNEKKWIKHGDKMVDTYVPIILNNFRTDQGIYGMHKGKINVYQKTLEIGDIIFKIDGKPFIIIERKTTMDLHSSIHDATKNYNRYHDQKMRIMSSDIPIKYYLVEGVIDNSNGYNFGENDKDRLYSAIVHTTLRDKIPVLRTFNMDDTLKTLEKILSTLIKFKTKLWDLYVTNADTTTDSNTIIDYSKVIKSKKKDNITPEVCFLLQLRQIPGVSHNIAQEIVKLYPNMKSLINAYNNVTSEKDKNNLLKEILVPSETNNKSRKLGPVVSARIASYLA
jgi:ERCC4-type nuclease